MRPLEKYGDKYLLRTDGVLFRRVPHTDDYEKVSASGDPPRVRLYQNGKERRVYVHVLLREVFWDRPLLAREFLE